MASMLTRRLVAKVLCSPPLISLMTNVAQAERLAKLELEQASNYFFANFQIVEIKNRIADAYLDVQALSKEKDFTTGLRPFIESAVSKFEEVIVFFTDKPVESVNLQIIRITNVNEYNVGSGYVVVGNAKITKMNDKWSIEKIDLSKLV